MHLSLSVRIGEGFLSKEESILSLEQVAEIASSAGFSSVCMRASQVGVQSSEAEVRAARKTLDQQQITVSMVTGDFDVVYNNENGPNCLRNIEPYLDLAMNLGAPLIRVAIKTKDDLIAAQSAADQAAERDIRLVHQCHTLSLFETVDAIVESLTTINRPNFGLIFEPANLEICGQDYGVETIERLAPWIYNVYLQNQILKPDGDITLPTWCRGPVSFDLIQIHDTGGVKFDRVFDGLRKIGYDRAVTVHQSAPDDPSESATRTADFLRTLE